MPDATALINEIVGGLENAATQVLNQFADDRTYAEVWGWNMPAVNRHDVAALLKELQQPLSDIIIEADGHVDDVTYSRLQPMPSRITYLLQNVLPHLPGGNANHAYASILSFVESARSILLPFDKRPLDFAEIAERQLLPTPQIKRLRSIDTNIDRLIGDMATLETKIALINEAHSTAESLPADMRMLKEARRAVEDAVKKAQVHQAGAETARKQSENKFTDIKKRHDEAVKLVQGTEAAFSAATTKGLGEEFGTRAKELSVEVRWLGAFLTVVLLVGGIITYFRLERVNEIISKPTFSSQALWAHVGLSVVSVAAPVWLAWLLTKQIGQRFRLSEDYAFKASVAKAYAGYSQEAARIDPEFQKRLYQTALTRIDEEPLRYVETDNHGSPLHEVLGRRFSRNGSKTSSDNKAATSDTSGSE